MAAAVLGAAANLVQVLSVISLIGGLAAWGRVRRSSPRQAVTRQVGLAGLLRDIAEAHAKSDTEIREALGRWDVDAFLDGTRQPEWDFVAAFLDVIAGGDHAIREGLEHLVRPTWEATRDQEHLGGAIEGATVVVQVTAENGMLLTVNQQTAEAGRAAGRLQESVTELGSWRVALVFTLGKYASAVSTLTVERDELAARLAAQQDNAREQESSHTTQAALMASELRDVQTRLAVAEQRREQVSRRLAATERKLVVAEDLRDKALAQAAHFRQQLAGLEHRPAPASPAIVSPATSDPYRLMGDTDERLGEEIVRRADDFLREQDTALSQHAATLTRLGKAVGRPGRSRIRAVAALAAALVIALGLGVLAYFDGTAANSPGSRPSATQYPATNSSSQPAFPTPLVPRLVATLADPGSQPIVESVAFSPDGATLAVGDQDGSTYLWSPATGSITATLTDPGNSSSAESVAFSRDGTTLAVGHNNGSTDLWNLATRSITATLTDPGNGPGNGAHVDSVAFSRDEATLAVGDSDGSTYLWSLATRRIIATLTDPEIPSIVWSVAFSPDGTTLAVGESHGNADLWHPASQTSLSSDRKSPRQSSPLALQQPVLPARKPPVAPLRPATTSRRAPRC